MSVLDNILIGYNKKEKNIPTSRQAIEDLIVDCFNAASERDIATGIPHNKNPLYFFR